MALPAVLAIDIGTKTGWAYHSPSGHVRSGVHINSCWADKPYHRYVQFRSFLYEFYHACHGKIDHIYYEDVRHHNGVIAAHVYGGLRAILMVFCHDKNIELMHIGVSVIKKYIAGHGLASKKNVIDAVNFAGYNVSDDNEADALALLLYVMDKRPYDMFKSSGKLYAHALAKSLDFPKKVCGVKRGRKRIERKVVLDLFDND